MTPFEQGYDAFLKGKQKDANKFGDKEPWSRTEWDRGWTKARRDRK